MLKKLLKYDLKNIYKVLVVFYILVIFFAIFTSFPSTDTLKILLSSIISFEIPYRHKEYSDMLG